MASTRLPGKPLADIAGEPMIAHVMRRAQEANYGDVIVACAEQEIADAVTQAGGTAVLTDAELPSGSDRIWQAYERIGKPDVDAIVNVQGDLPTIEPHVLQDVVQCLQETNTDIATLGNRIDSNEEWLNPNVVKIALAKPEGAHQGAALYFSRSPIPSGDAPKWHHIGIYAYRPATLERFVGLSPSPLEISERLEQLRALEAGMSIGCRIVSTTPFGVDTPEDLEKARQIIGEMITS